MLGIAVDTIAFTPLNSLALRPMPVREPSRVVRIFTRRRERPAGQASVSYPDYQSYRDQPQSFDAVCRILFRARYPGRSRRPDIDAAGGARLRGFGQPFPGARHRAVDRPLCSTARRGAEPGGRPGRGHQLRDLAAPLRRRVRRRRQDHRGQRAAVRDRRRRAATVRAAPSRSRLMSGCRCRHWRYSKAATG